MINHNTKSNVIKTRMISILLVMFMVTTSFVGTISVIGAETQPDEPNVPYNISTIQDLQDMNLDLTGDYTILNDIDATITNTWNAGLGFDPIGDEITELFTGTLEGNGYTISNLYINRPTENDIALIGATDEPFGLYNLTLTNVDITGDELVGSFVGWCGGYLGDGTVSNCHSTGSVTGTGNWVGGFVGYQYYISIENSSTTCEVSGIDDVGGFVGWNDGDIGNIIQNCSSIGDVTGVNYVGGFIGKAHNSIENCYATGNATGNSEVGGFVGDVESTIENCYATGNAIGTHPLYIAGFAGFVDGIIINCYSIGTTSSTTTGGFIGSSFGATITDCFWDTDTSGTLLSAGGTGKTTIEMYQEVTFTNWDFTTPIWYITEGMYYPTLVEEILFSYDITNVYELQNMNLDLNGDYRIMNNIDAGVTSSWNGGFGFDPIGDWSTKFTGVFNGQNYTISNLYINRPAEDSIGLFGVNGGIIKNCSVNGIITGDEYVGGFVGDNLGTITYCFTDCIVNGASFVGGFVGTIYNGYDISNCYVTGDATGSGSYIGGFIGENFGTITNCYSTGIPTGGIEVGGFIGHNGGTTTDCFWDTDTSGTLTSDGGTGKTTIEMKQEATFTNWDFTTPIWNIVETITYPHLNPQTYEFSYDIYTLEQLQNMNMDLNGDYKIMNNIDASITSTWNGGDGFVPIGDYITQFTGTFNGNNYTISNLYINRPSENFVGLFGYIDNSIVNDIYLTNVDMIGKIEIGGLSGEIENSNVVNCYTTGNIYGEGSVGGFVGLNLNSNIINCYSTVNVTGNFDTGGFIGFSQGTTINCYSIGIVTCMPNNGFIGISMSSITTNCFWDTDTSGTLTSDGGTGKTTIQMKQQATFTNWDFATIWGIEETITYPYFVYITFIPIEANAGINETIYRGEYTFDGSNINGIGIINYTWNFTDSGMQYLYDATPTYNFTNLGMFNITLNVTDDNGYDIDNVTITVVNGLPVAVAEPDITIHRGEYTFDGSGSYDQDLTWFDYIDNYTWNFTDSGDQIIYDVSPIYNFTNLGVFNITLNVTDNIGNYSYDYIIINVTNQLPIADAGLSESVYRGEYIFDGSGSYDQDPLWFDNINNWTWTFDDGGAQELWDATPTYNFTNLGIFVITLNVTDNEGNYSEDVVTITVNNQLPIANAGITQGGYNGFYRLYGNESYDQDPIWFGSVVNWTWGFWYDSEIKLLYDETLNFTFDIIGDYEITLLVTDNNGDTDIDTTWVNITSLVDYYDSGIYGPMWVLDNNNPAEPTWAYLDGIFDASGETTNETVHKLSSSIDAPTHSSVIYNNSIISNLDYTIQWRQYVERIDKDDNVKLVVDSFGKSNVLILERDAYTLNGINTPYVLTDNTWREWTVIITNSGTDAYLFLDGIPLTMESTILTSTFNNISFEMTSDNIGGQSFAWLDYITIDEYDGAEVEAGPDQTVYTNTTVHFDGSGCGITVQNWTWTFTYDGNNEELWEVNPSFYFTDVLTPIIVTLTVFDGITYSDDTMFVFIENRAPIANAGPDQGPERYLITFDGHLSDDPDGSIVEYIWYIQYNGTTETKTGMYPEFNFNVSGVYDVMLRVEDDQGDWGYDFVNITIFFDLPIAYAGPDDAQGKDPYTFAGTATDNDGTIEHISWYFMYDGTMVWMNGSLTPIFDFQILGTYIVTLNVTDDDWRYHEDTMTLIIGPSWPIVYAGPDQSDKRDITFAGTATDLDGTIENITWNFTYDGSMMYIYDSLTPTFDFNITGVYCIMLNATDDDDLSSYDFVNITITILAPIVNAGPDVVADKNYTHFFTGSATDDDIIVEYVWTFIYNGNPKTLVGTNPWFDFELVGDTEITLTVRDNDWRYGTDIMWVNITPHIPIADAGPNKIEKRFVEFIGSGIDSDGWIVGYEWTVYDGTAGEPYTYTTSTIIHDFNVSGGPYTLILRVEDDSGLYGYDTTEITVNILPPVANAGPDLGTGKGDYNPSGSGTIDPDEEPGDVIIYRWKFTYDGQDETLYGVIMPTFTFLLEVDTEITLNITDNDYRFDEDIMWINITWVNPVADAGGPYGDDRGPYTLDGSGSYDPDSTVYGQIDLWVWSIDYDSVVYPRSGEVIIFDFLKAGTWDISLTVTDNNGLFHTDTTTVTITFKPPVAGIYYTPYDDNRGPKLFTAASSYDPDGLPGDILTYEWEFTYDGNPETYNGITFTFPFMLDIATTITLTVTDCDTLFDTTTEVVTIEYKPPVAIADNQGADHVYMMTTEWFNATESYDPDGLPGEVLNYTWEFIYDNDTYVLYGMGIYHLFNITNDEGPLNITLTVRDANGLTNSTNITIELVKISTAMINIMMVLFIIIMAILVILIILKVLKSISFDDSTNLSSKGKKKYSKKKKE